VEHEDAMNYAYLEDGPFAGRTVPITDAMHRRREVRLPVPPMHHILEKPELVAELVEPARTVTYQGRVELQQGRFVLRWWVQD